MEKIDFCPVCGGTELKFRSVMWDDLNEAWQLSPEEIAYIDRQQGFYCPDCVNNLRGMALADAITTAFGFDGILKDFVATKAAKSLEILEINTACNLSVVLGSLPGHRLMSYPDIDMMNMAIEDNSFDLVIHSDTLEHIPRPLPAMAECRRVLRDGGHCIYTIPVIAGRMSRSREGLSASYHGVPGSDLADYTVWTEFGADFWTYPLRAGFDAVKIHALEFPAGLAIDAT